MLAFENRDARVPYKNERSDWRYEDESRAMVWIDIIIVN